MADIMTSMGIKLEPAPSGLSAEHNLYMAKLAEAADRFDEMKEYMNMAVSKKSGDELTVEDRNLLSVAYKNSVSQLRTAFRTLGYEQGSDLADAAREAYQNKIAGELFACIADVEEKVVNKFTKGPEAGTQPELLVFMHKMAGDYNRYGAEITEGDQKEQFSAKAKEAYQRATDCLADMPSTNPIRLGLALNRSVFFYEIYEEKQQAHDMAQQAFDEAIEELDKLEEEEYRDATLIMQLLKDNLALWSEQAEGDQ